MTTHSGPARHPAVVPDVDALVSRYVTPGTHLHLAMTMARPNAMVYALARQFAGRGAFTVSTSATHTAMHALTMSGAVDHLITCFLGDTYPTPRPNPLYRDLARGEPFTCELWSLLSFTQRLTAGATGLPYGVTASLVGSDLERGLAAGGRGPLPGGDGGTADGTPKFVRMADPHGTDRTFGLVEPLRPDLTLLHGACADRRGNIVLVPPAGEGAWAAYAARRGVLASVERIVPDAFVDAHPERVVIPGQRVVALCEAPLGAHPQSLRGLSTGEATQDITGYRDDYAFLTELVESLATEDGAKEWYREWVEEPGGHAAYLRKLGPARHAELTLDARPLSPRAPVTPPRDPAPPFTAQPPRTAATPRPRPEPRTPVSRQERTVILGARAIVQRVTEDGYDTLLAGIGVSHLAAWLAAARLREQGVRVPVCAELGFYGMDPEPGDVFLFSQLHATRSQQLAGITEILGGMVAGNRRCLGVLAAGEVDSRGDINTSLLADGRWLTGSGGANDIATSTDCLVLSTASPRKFVERVAYVTSPGARVREVVSHFGRFRRDGGAGSPFRLATWLPPGDDGPVTPQEAVAQLTRWPAPTSGCVPEPEVTQAEVAWLRSLDPQGFYR
ncbi:CoA-transferase [Streptomyces dubilierae]|uniref:CoA-transferase n=1 Tax=Streptomyces dubilierae TaxID=3075533 RepID=A0ABU2PK36_9ACTN|nr:CoA-transferase [Streptomyces sp. DSM 41921]MDT0392073.1 CoA-transferase [Streptomyces sp. DSM 41921]